MSECIFCNIASNKIPSNSVYEDDNFFAFLDIHPLSPGHTLVIPKKHYRWVWEVPNVGNYFEVAKKIALAQQKLFGTEAIHSKIVGEEVHHAHIWVYPDPREAHGDKNDFAANAEHLRELLLL